MARTNYLRFENPEIAAQRSPNPTTLVAIARAVGVAAHELTTTDPEEVTLRDLREYAGLYQKEVAEAIGWTSSRSYADIEAGHRALPTRLRRRLANVLGVDVERLDTALHRSGAEAERR